MPIPTNSFRLKISLLSVIFSSLVVIALGTTFLAVLKRIGISRIDQEITALGESHLRGQPPPEHWAVLGRSLRYIYGEDYSDKIIFKAITDEGVLFHQSTNWNSAVLDHQLAIPIQTSVSQLREDSIRPEDFARMHGMTASPGPGRRPGPGSGAGSGAGSGLGPGAGPEHGMEPPGGHFSDRRRPSPGKHPRLPHPTFKTLPSSDKLWRIGLFDTDHITLGIGINLAEVRAENDRFLLVFFLAAPLALILLGVSGWLLGCHALRPVNLIARTAENISAVDLAKRIPTVRSDREFTVLIQTINGMLARLERSFHQAARFSADAAHELKTPLTILQGQLDQAIQDSDDGSDDQKVYSELLEEVVRLKSIIAKLLLLAQADSGSLAVSRLPMNLTEGVELCFADLDLQAGNVALTSDIQQGVWVQADEVMITQILVNLFSNAIKYNSELGKLEVTLSTRDGIAELCVSNTGDPISGTDRERIFERFFRMDKAHARTRDGVGLGLSLAREIARSHEGDLALADAPTGWNAFLLTIRTIPAPDPTSEQQT